MILIFDIDDVLRDLTKKIRQYAKIFFRGKVENYVDHNLNQQEIELFNFINKDRKLFASLFEYSYCNTPLCQFIKDISKENEVYCLSCNSNVEAIKHTKKFIKEHTDIKEENIIFVRKSYDKINWVKNNIKNLNDIVFVDDRLDTCKDFQFNNVIAFWLTEFRSLEAQKMWIDKCGEYDLKGGNKELMMFLNELV